MVLWPRDTIMWDFRADASVVDLTDLRFISPDFPAMTGHANVVAHSLSGRRTDYTLTHLLLTDGPERIEGSLVAEVDAVDGLGVRRLELRLNELNLDKVRPYIDSLPFIGLISGPVEADGDLNDIAARGDIVFTDLAVPGRPTTTMSFDGRFQTGTGDLVFDKVAIARSDIDLRTVRNLAPAVILEGRLNAVGSLDGPLTNATFTGTARHKDGARPESIVDGYLRLDSRTDSIKVAADVTLAPLSFEGIRATFPSILSEGTLRGRVKLDGPVDRLFVDGDVQGEIGVVKGSGTVTILPPRWGADSLKLDFRHLDLQALTGREGRTSLDGRIEATGVMDTLVAPEGRVNLVLGPGVFRGVHLDTLTVGAQVRDSLVTIDTAWARGSGMILAGAGTVGWARPHRGSMDLTLEADSLVELDSLAQELTGLTRDTLPGWRALNGILRVKAQVAGSLDSLEATAEGSLRGLTFNHFRANNLQVTGGWTGGARPELTMTAALDSISREERFVRDLKLSLSGPADSLDWTLSGDDGGIVKIAGTGRAWRDDSLRAVAIDSLALGLPTRAWRLLDTVDHPARRLDGAGVAAPHPGHRRLGVPQRLRARAVDRPGRPRGRGARALPARPLRAGAVRHDGRARMAGVPGADERHALGSHDGGDDRARGPAAGRHTRADGTGRLQLRRAASRRRPAAVPHREPGDADALLAAARPGAAKGEGAAHPRSVEHPGHGGQRAAQRAGTGEPVGAPRDRAPQRRRAGGGHMGRTGPRRVHPGGRWRADG